MMWIWLYVYAGMLIFLLMMHTNAGTINKIKQYGMSSSIAGCAIVTVFWLPAVWIGILLSIVTLFRGK